MAWVSVGFRSINIDNNKKTTMQSVTFDLTSAWDKTTTSLARFEIQKTEYFFSFALSRPHAFSGPS